MHSLDHHTSGTYTRSIVTQKILIAETRFKAFSRDLSKVLSMKETLQQSKMTRQHNNRFFFKHAFCFFLNASTHSMM